MTHDTAGFRVETVFAIDDPDIRRQCWLGYDEAHQDSAELCIQEQRCFTETTFDEVLRDPEYIKHLLFDKDRVIAVIGGTNNLEKARVAYVNPEVLRRRHPQAVAEGRLWYMPILFVRQGYQGQGCSDRLFEEHAAYFVERDWMIASDYAMAKHPWFNLEYFTNVYRKAFQRRGLAYAPATQSLGGQEYFSIDFTKTS